MTQRFAYCQYVRERGPGSANDCLNKTKPELERFRVKVLSKQWLMTVQPPRCVCVTGLLGLFREQPFSPRGEP